MARTTAPLTDTACRTAKPREREYKLFDGDGLYLLVQPNGRKGWRLRYVKPDGREGLTALGSYPVVGLGDARRTILKKPRRQSGLLRFWGSSSHTPHPVTPATTPYAAS